MACQYVFGEVHILTLTFGTSLIGVSVDYAMHYFVNRMPSDGREHAAQHRAGADPRLHDHGRGVSHLPHRADPGLRQIALFSAVGLATACAIVILLYPRALEALEPSCSGGCVSKATRRRARCRAGWRASPALRVDDAAAAPRRLGAAGAARWQSRLWGSRGSTPRDDVRALQRPPPELVAAEQTRAQVVRRGLRHAFRAGRRRRRPRTCCAGSRRSNRCCRRSSATAGSRAT